MTNYLSTAMLTAGANCFAALLEIEQNMSQAEVNTLMASEMMMQAQPTLVQGTINLYNAQANDQLWSGIFAGAGQIGAGLAQLGLTIRGADVGEDAATKAYNEELNPSTAKVTSTAVAPKDLTGTEEADVEGDNSQPAPADESPAAEHQAAASENAASETTEQTKEQKAEAEAKAKKAANKARLAVVQNYQTYSTLAGNLSNGGGIFGKGFYDMYGTQNGGLAAALGTVASNNQTAQSSNSTLVQTYKDAFANAAQVLAGIVSAQNH